MALGCLRSGCVGRGWYKTHIVEENYHLFGGTVKFTVSCEKKIAFPFYLRIPQWCEVFELTVDGQKSPKEKCGSVLCLEGE